MLVRNGVRNIGKFCVRIRWMILYLKRYDFMKAAIAFLRDCEAAG